MNAVGQINKRKAPLKIWESATTTSTSVITNSNCQTHHRCLDGFRKQEQSKPLKQFLADGCLTQASTSPKEIYAFSIPQAFTVVLGLELNSHNLRSSAIQNHKFERIKTQAIVIWPY